MGLAAVLTTASKTSTTGGTFADTLTANSGDAVAVANFGDGAARITEAWAMDDTSVAEIQFVYSRPQATHDTTHGFRAQIASKIANVAGKTGAQEVLPGRAIINLFKSDIPVVSVTTTAGDGIAASWVTLYDDLPGVNAVLSSWPQVQSLHVSTLGIFVNAAASGTKGAYGATRAFNADDNRLHANTWYAILGYTMQLPILTVSLLGPDWGGQRVGGPGDPLAFQTGMWFVDQSIKWGLPLIPCFNSNNAGNVLVQLADVPASTTPALDFLLYELSGPPSPGA